MNRGRAQFGIAFAISIFLILQSFIAPVAQANVSASAALEAALGVICSTDSSHKNGSGDQQKPENCDLPCCLPSFRSGVDIDVPTILAIFVFLSPSVDLVDCFHFYDASDLVYRTTSRQHSARAPPIDS